MGTRACKGDEADDTILIPLRFFFCRGLSFDVCSIMYANEELSVSKGCTQYNA